MIVFAKAINRHTAVSTMQNILKCKKLKTVFVQYTVHKIALINIIYFTVKFVVIRGRGRVQYGALRSGGKSGRRG